MFKTDIYYYTARRLADMAQSMGKLAKAFDDGISPGRQLTRDDGLAAMQASAAMVCEGCPGCGIYAEGVREDSYYLYYLLRAFEQKGQVDGTDMPQGFQAECKRQPDYLYQLNRSLGRAAMNLSWKNRFLESRDAVISQFRELAAILEEFSHQIDGAKDITEEYEAGLRRLFRRNRMSVEGLLLFEYETGRRELYLTVHTNNGRCITAKDAALLLGQAVGGTRWNPARDSRSIITRQSGTVRFVEEGAYHLLCGAASLPCQGERYSGDNYTICESQEHQVVLGISDGMGCGETAFRESRQVVELTQQLMEAGFGARSALKLVNTVLLLAGREQHPATLDISCVDLYTGVLEVMKLGAVPTFVISEERVEILAAGEAPAGILNGVEPVLLSRKLWDGDRIVMVTDGVLDALPGEDKERAMREMLEGMGELTPQELAERVLDFAAGCIPAARDDMTVVAARIWQEERIEER